MPVAEINLTREVHEAVPTPAWRRSIIAEFEGARILCNATCAFWWAVHNVEGREETSEQGELAKKYGVLCRCAPLPQKSPFRRRCTAKAHKGDNVGAEEENNLDREDQ